MNTYLKSTQQMTKKKVFRYIAITAVIIEIFPPIKGYFDVPNIIVMCSVIFTALFFYPRSFCNKINLFFAISAIIIMSNVIYKDNFDFVWFRITLLYWLFALSIWNIFYYTKDIVGFKLLSLICLSIIIICSLLTIPAANLNQSIVRDVSSSSDRVGFLLQREYQKMGILGYGLVHSIPVLFPVLIYLYKNNNKYKMLYLFCILILFFTILKASFGTVLLISSLIIPLSIIINTNNKKNILLFIFLSSITLIMLSSNLIIDVLDQLKSLFNGSETIFKKIDDIQISIKLGKEVGQVGNRSELYNMSWKTFFENPIYGSMDYTGGGEHSFIADFLAWFGLIGTVPLFIYFFLIIKRTITSINTSMRNYYYLCLVPFIIQSFLKGTPFLEQIIFLLIVVPGLFYINYQQNQIKQIIQ